MLHRVILYDLSGYADNVVFDSNAPVYDILLFDSSDDAWDAVFEYSDLFQCAIEPVEGDVSPSDSVAVAAQNRKRAPLRKLPRRQMVGECVSNTGTLSDALPHSHSQTKDST